jgi:hypothetical protein
LPIGKGVNVGGRGGPVGETAGRRNRDASVQKSQGRGLILVNVTRLVPSVSLYVVPYLIGHRSHPTLTQLPILEVSTLSTETLLATSLSLYFSIVYAYTFVRSRCLFVTKAKR